MYLYIVKAVVEGQVSSFFLQQKKHNLVADLRIRPVCFLYIIKFCEYSWAIVILVKFFNQNKFSNGQIITSASISA